NLNLNIDLESEDKDAEVLALAAVLALERFRQPVGYTPLFFASIGWYSRVSSVREQAARVLDKLVDDPTGILHGLVRLETDYTVKFEALEAAGRSGAPAAAKAAVAAEAVRQGLVNVAASAVETSTLGRLRQRGLELLIEYGPADVGVTEYLEEIISGRLDINEQLTAVAALEADGRSEAVAVLVRFLKKQNERQLSGLSPADYRVVKSVIITLGEIGDPAAFEELTMVKISNWPAALVRDAQEALDKLKQATPAGGAGATVSVSS
ncbi:MAG: HEAT repeat domain-containing protein, partial [Spirochaetales bacterium]|nr:HEAT repeat domain-containing protein [Spirochaetales bacterium]